MSVWICDACSVVYAESVCAMNSTSSVACMSCGKDMVGNASDWNVWIKELVADSKRARRMRGVRGAEVVLDSVCTITRSSRTLKT